MELLTARRQARDEASRMKENIKLNGGSTSKENYELFKADMELLGRYEENAYFFRMMKVIENKHVKLFELEGLDHVEMMKPGISLLMKEVGLILKVK